MEPDLAPDREVDPIVDPAGLEEVFLAEYVRLVRMAAVSLGSVAQAEDVVADAFVQACRHWKKVGAYEDPAGWLRRVVLNLSMSRWRGLASEGALISKLRRRRPRAHEPPNLPDDELWGHVRSLPRRQQEVVVLIVVDGLSVDETSRVLGCGVETVRTHYRRARESLRSRLEADHEA